MGDDQRCVALSAKDVPTMFKIAGEFSRGPSWKVLGDVDVFREVEMGVLYGAGGNVKTGVTGILHCWEERFKEVGLIYTGD